jgi:hypothetical protein
MNFVFNHEDFIYLCKKYQDYEMERPISNNGECFMNSLNSELVIGVFNNELETLVHELTHAVLFITEQRHFSAYDSNGETMAYIMGHLFDEGKKRMDKYNAKP